MKIKKIYISAFGGLKDFSMDFSDGFNECGHVRSPDCTLSLMCELAQMSVCVPPRSGKKRDKTIVTQMNSPSFW